MTVNLRFSARSIARTLAGIAVTLALVSLILGLLHLWTQDSNLFLPKLRRIFDVDQEANIPSWYSALLLFVSASLLAVIAVAREQAKDRFAGHWATLAVIFMLVSIDEAAAFHEYFSNAIRNVLDLQTKFPIWVLAGVVLVAGLAFYFARFLLALPPRTRRLLFASGVIYIGGAIITESVQGFLNMAGLYYGVRYVGLITLEELLEMLGVVTFIYGLLLHLSVVQSSVVFRFDE